MQGRRKDGRSGSSTRLLAEKTSFREITRGLGAMKSRCVLPANQTLKFNANLIRLGVDYKFR
jgi:hypothetical protein